MQKNKWEKNVSMMLSNAENERGNQQEMSHLFITSETFVKLSM